MLDSTLTPSDSNNQLNLCPSAVKNDTLAFPIELDSVRSLSHLVLAIIGLPLNLFVGVVIISFRRLRRKPRNILWLGVTIANILTLLTILFELYASYWKNEIACKLFVAMTGIAYTWLLFNLLLALSDRYIAIAHPLAHRKVNIKGVVVIQTVSFILIAFFIKFHFITGLIPLTCASKIPEHSKLIAISNILLVTLCLIAHVIVYLKSKPYFNKKEGRQLTVAFTNQRNVPLSTSSAVVISSGGASIDHKNPTVLASRDSLKVHGGSRKMEVDATYGLLVGVFSLLLFTFPTLISGFAEWGCWVANYGCECPGIAKVTLYLRELLLAHLIYNPIIFIVRNHQFKKAIIDKLCRRFNQNDL